METEIRQIEDEGELNKSKISQRCGLRPIPYDWHYY